MKEWAETSLQWAGDKFGKSNIKGAVLHLDECQTGSPHVQICLTAIDPTGRLNARFFTGGRAKLRALWTEYAGAMKKYGLKRGREFSPAKHREIKEFYSDVKRGIELAKGRDFTADELPAPTMGDHMNPTEYAVKLVNHAATFYRKQNGNLRAELEALISQCNEESGLSMQLVVDDPECFDTLLAHYGMFKNVKNYIAVVGPKALADLDVRGGYYGQKIVLAAQMMGLNTCWVAGTYKRGKCKAEVADNEKIVCVIAIGYGENQGTKHKSKPLAKICNIPEADMPVWFKNGVKAAMMAPTAMNQQKFKITLDGNNPVITAGRGPMTGIDLGIVKYNFEAASGHKV